MSNKFIIPGPPVVGAVTSGIATASFSVGPRYHVVWMKFTTTAAAPTLSTLCTRIRFKINGRDQRVLSALQLNAYNCLWGQQYCAYLTTAAAPNVPVAYFDAEGTCRKLDVAVTAGAVGLNGYTGEPYTTAAANIIHLPMFFAEPWRQEYAAIDKMALPTAWDGPGLVGTVEMEWTLSTIAAAASALSLDMEVDYERGASVDGRPVLLLSKMSQAQLTGLSANTWGYLTTLPRKDVYQSLHLWSDHASDKVSLVQVKVENNLIRDVNKLRLDQVNIARGANPMAISSQRTDVVFDYDDVPANGLPMVYGGRQVQDFQLIIQKDAVNATTASVMAVTFGPMD